AVVDPGTAGERRRPFDETFAGQGALEVEVPELARKAARRSAVELERPRRRPGRQAGVELAQLLEAETGRAFDAGVFVDLHGRVAIHMRVLDPHHLVLVDRELAARIERAGVARTLQGEAQIGSDDALISYAVEAAVAVAATQPDAPVDRLRIARAAVLRQDRRRAKGRAAHDGCHEPQPRDGQRDTQNELQRPKSA